MRINSDFYRMNPYLRGYLNGSYYAMPVTNAGIPPGNPQTEVAAMKKYFPALEVKYCPTLRCWGLFQEVPISTMRKYGFLIKGNGIDPEYVFCGKLKTFVGLAKNVRVNDPYKIKRRKEFIRKIHQKNRELHLKRKQTIHDDMVHIGKANKHWLNKHIEPLTKGSFYDFDGTKVSKN